jgi:hypothetical protein
MPREIGACERPIRQLAIDFLERKRPELLAVLADINLHLGTSEGNHPQDQAWLLQDCRASVSDAIE